MRVIPSRADGEGPQMRSIAFALHDALFVRSRGWVFCVNEPAWERSLAVCAARDDIASPLRSLILTHG